MMTRKAYLDSCCLIYLLEDAPVFSEKMRRYLVGCSDVVLCVSPLVRLEVLVKPLADQDLNLVSDYEDFLREQHWLAIDDRVFGLALQLRVRHQIKTPDALHLATALHHDCAEFWTNDDRLRSAAMIAGCVAQNVLVE